jgi:uncharacterized protein (DUF302 family)
MYAYKKQVNMPYEKAVQRIKEELKQQGFGVLTEIDVRDTLKKKLNVDFGDYVILGACNPPFAYKALQEETDIGIVMPCNVIVYSKAGKTFIASTLPSVTMNVVKNDRLASIAGEVEGKLKAAVDAV